MGEYHAYYANASRALGAKGLIAKLNRHVAGATIFYRIEGPMSLGVIYYVAVYPEFQGNNIGKVLVLSAEEVLGDVNVYLANIEKENVVSQKLFSSLGYVLVDLNSLYLRDSSATKALKMAACAYEDDVAALKSVKVGVNSIINMLKMKDVIRVIKKVWRRGCYKPWLRLLSSRDPYKGFK